MVSYTQKTAANLVAGMLSGNLGVAPNMAAIFITNDMNHAPLAFSSTSYATIYDTIEQDDTLDMILVPTQALSNPTVDIEAGTAEISYYSLVDISAATATVFGRVSPSFCYVLGTGVAKTGASRAQDRYYTLASYESDSLFIAIGDATQFEVISTLNIG